MMENLGYYGCGSVNSEGAYWQDAYNRLGQSRPVLLRCPAQRLLWRSLQSAVRQGPEVRLGWNKAVDLILGGWNVNYFANAHSGFPVTVFASAANSGGQDASRQPARQRLPAVRNHFADRGPRSSVR